MRKGDVLVGSALVTAHGGGHWCHLVVIIHLGCCLLLLPFVAVHHRWLLSIVRSCLSCVVEFFSVAGG